MSLGLNIATWKHLYDYHDKQLIDFLEYGWPADFTADRPPIPAVENHQNDDESLAAIRSYIEKESGFGAMLGPFIPWMQISPIMT